MPRVNIDKLLAELKMRLSGLYGNRLVGVYLFGSYARGDWGVGSDLDILVVLRDSPVEFWTRGIEFDTSKLPVPTEILVYTVTEWENLAEEDCRFYRTIQKEANWLYLRDDFRP